MIRYSSKHVELSYKKHVKSSKVKVLHQNRNGIGERSRGTSPCVFISTNHYPSGELLSIVQVPVPHDRGLQMLNQRGLSKYLVRSLTTLAKILFSIHKCCTAHDLLVIAPFMSAANVDIALGGNCPFHSLAWQHKEEQMTCTTMNMVFQVNWPHP